MAPSIADEEGKEAEEGLLLSLLLHHFPIKVEKSQRQPIASQRNWYPYGITLAACFIVAIYLIFGFITPMSSVHNIDHSAPHEVSTCGKPTIRQEWRTLDSVQKKAYVNAVQCLRTIPSGLFPNLSLYDDFVWTHSHIGSGVHGTAAFLAWHRYFIHTYETALKANCSYTGSLTYWDWTLDWQNITQSPVWDSETGFGGNGDVNGVATVGSGYCVVDGPFANLEAVIYGVEENIHCLSRGFRTGDEFQRLCRHGIRPGAVEELLRSGDYASFNLGLEHGAHRVIPNCVRGDWLRFSAPYGMCPERRKQTISLH